MNPCDNCTRQEYSTCYGCEYAETERKVEPERTLAQTFTDNLEVGWDYAIEQLENAKVDCVIRECIEQYWKAYDYLQDNDVDGGKCFELRQWAIKEILKRLEEK
jgi:hypothetical protein